MTKGRNSELASAFARAGAIPAARPHLVVPEPPDSPSAPEPRERRGSVKGTEAAPARTKPYRHPISIMTVEMHHYLQEAARDMDRAPWRDGTGRPVSMNEIILALIDEHRENPDLRDAVENRIRKVRLGG